MREAVAQGVGFDRDPLFARVCRISGCRTDFRFRAERPLATFAAATRKGSPKGWAGGRAEGFIGIDTTNDCQKANPAVVFSSMPMELATTLGPDPDPSRRRVRTTAAIFSEEALKRSTHPSCHPRESGDPAPWRVLDRQIATLAAMDARVRGHDNVGKRFFPQTPPQVLENARNAGG